MRKFVLSVSAAVLAGVILFFLLPTRNENPISTSGPNSPSIGGDADVTINYNQNLSAESRVAIEAPRYSVDKPNEEWNHKEFDLVREKGSVIQVGDCPGPKCQVFELGEVGETDEGYHYQEIFLRGAGFGVEYSANPFSHATNNMNLILGGRIAPVSDSADLRADIRLKQDSMILMCTREVDVWLRILSAEVESLKLRISTKPGSWSPGLYPGKCEWMDQAVRSRRITSP